MTAGVSLAITQQRLARHYLNKLRVADEAVRRGQANTIYGLAVFDQEWEQIRHWQAWATQRQVGDETWRRLCSEFPLAGMEILASRNSAADQEVWLTTALEAARQLRNREAERDLCYEMFMTHYRLGHPEQVEAFAAQLLKLGKAAHDSLSIERAYFGFGLAAEDQGKYAEAESHYQRALQISMELGNDDEIGQALNGLGAVSTYLGDHQKAYGYFLRQLELTGTTGKKSKVCHALLSMGGVLLWLKDYASAEDYLQRAATLSRALGLRRLLGVSLIHLGSVALEQNQLDSAYHYLEEGLEAVRSVGIVRQIMSGLSLLGTVGLQMGDLQSALAYSQEGLAMAREAGSPRYICDLQSTLAKTYLALNNPNSAREALREALLIAQKSGARPQQVETVFTAVVYYQYRDRNEQAALMAGTLQNEPDLNPILFTAVCRQLKASLGSDAFEQLLAQGNTRTLSDVVAEILTVEA